MPLFFKKSQEAAPSQLFFNPRVPWFSSSFFFFLFLLPCQTLHNYNMSMLQRLTRNITTRCFSTTRTALSTAETTTPPKATGLYQFFENNEALPKQIWTGKKRNKKRKGRRKINHGD